MPERVLVIGAGLGALSGALRLARLGFEVTLFEKNPQIGGKLHEKKLGAYRFDAGPSLLTMPFVIDELFEFLGFRRRDFLEFVPVDPICRYFYPDGARLDASSDIEKMKREIARLSPSDAEVYENFLSYTERIYKLTADIFLFSPIHEPGEMLKWRNVPMLLKLPQIDPLRSVHQGVSRFFKDARVVQLFDRYATYNGSDPYCAPATLNVIPYVEFVLGSYYIRGGMYRLAEALLEIAGKLGVKIHTSRRVEKIFHDGRRVTGLLADGEKFDADCILCGQDVVTAYNQLIDGFARRRAKLNRLEPSCSGLVFLWGVGKKHPQLAHHNIFFSGDYKKEFTQIFEEKRPPDDPTIYIAITSKSDPDHAPEKGENWFVLLNMPYLTATMDWHNEIAHVRKIVLTKLRQEGFDVENRIEAEFVLSPKDFEKNYLGNRGSFYGISSNSPATAFKRPANRSRELKGLYFAGGSTHPGGGIPLVLLSGKIAAELIAKAKRQVF
ncbi:MAG: phytoene desaturase family protein [candidate division KSB1 bacterium]|nr:phytoene desaturase family protein [candidate division KSB1 bacterium]MDZ7366439.1 phytoene desaturase family protein [candidate division KSB1 bacterium]MDZ7404599.1 phytoene desaturase family protein [candidate division KSB1 bacterium]